MLERTNIGLLDHIFRDTVVADHASGDAKEPLIVPGHQHAKGARISCRDALYQKAVPDPVIRDGADICLS